MTDSQLPQTHRTRGAGAAAETGEAVSYAAVCREAAPIYSVSADPGNWKMADALRALAALIERAEAWHKDPRPIGELTEPELWEVANSGMALLDKLAAGFTPVPDGARKKR